MERRRARPRGGLGMMLLGLLLAGCAGRSLQVASAGLPGPADVALSLAVAQTRAEHAAAAASGLAYTSRPAPPDQAPPQLALRAPGVGFVRLLGGAQPAPAQIALYLDKSSYAGGALRIAFAGQPEQSWPIIAYQLRGSAEGELEYTYVLTTPTGNVRYLVLLGGTFRDQGQDFTALEGTLLFPAPTATGAEQQIENWSVAYKFDFGFHEPARPAFLAQVEEEERLFRQLERDVPALDEVYQRLDALQKQVQAPPPAPRSGAASPAPAGAPASAGQAGPGSAEQQASLEALRRQMTDRAAAAQAAALRYFTVLRELDDAFAAFLKSNFYTWRTGRVQQGYFNSWQSVEAHRPRLDELVNKLLAYAQDAPAIDKARQAALAEVAKNRNRDQDPRATGRR